MQRKLHQPICYLALWDIIRKDEGTYFWDLVLCFVLVLLAHVLHFLAMQIASPVLSTFLRVILRSNLAISQSLMLLIQIDLISFQGPHITLISDPSPVWAYQTDWYYCPFIAWAHHTIFIFDPSVAWTNHAPSCYPLTCQNPFQELFSKTPPWFCLRIHPPVEHSGPWAKVPEGPWTSICMEEETHVGSLV